MVFAGEILEEIERGEDIEYDHVKIRGLFDLSQHEIKSQIQISDSEFDGQVIIRDTIFKNSANFTGTTFADDVKFENTSFGEKAIFAQTLFKKDAEFIDDNFCNNAYFLGSTFDDYVCFDNTKFQIQCYFDGVMFKKYSSYINTNFSSDANFGNSVFEKGAGFQNARFGGLVSFSEAKFNEDAYFYGTKFDKEAKFTNAKFEEDAEFWGAVFHQNARFDGATFNKNAYLNDNPTLELKGAKFEGDLILDDTVIHSMNLNNAEFGGQISLNNSDFARLKTNWTALKGPLYYNGQVYLALIKNFKEQEQFEDADDCYFDYRYGSKDGWLDYLSWISCGFGVRPKYTLLMSAAIILIFGFAFWLNGEIKISPVPGEDDSRKSIGKKRRRSWEYLAEALIFSLLIFTFQTREDWRASGINRILAVVEGVLGIGLISLFVVTLANIMIRY
ncbi:MAG TPA: pentapeptide repeat-containing protein [Methanothrix sp.]|nr:pentapeptide repeat-containing protein [Methanothrix sp.]